MTAVATEATLLDAVPKGLFIAGDWLSTPATLAVEDRSAGEAGRDGIEESLDTKYMAIAR